MAPANKCDTSKLKAGDLMSRISYMRIVRDMGTSFEVKNEEGYTWTISKDIVAKECYSADHYEKEVKVTRTELANFLTDKARDAAFTVQFAKKPTKKRAAELLKQMFEEDHKATKKFYTGVATAALSGEKRVLRGRLLGEEQRMGRTQVVDLDIESGHNARQVDHRTIDYIICRNKKMVAKR